MYCIMDPSCITTIHDLQPSSKDSGGDRDYIKLADLSFRFICIMDTHSLETALPVGLPNHSVDLLGLGISFIISNCESRVLHST